MIRVGDRTFYRIGLRSTCWKMLSGHNSRGRGWSRRCDGNLVRMVGGVLGCRNCGAKYDCDECDGRTYAALREAA
jgi:hypothetical protein